MYYVKSTDPLLQKYVDTYTDYSAQRSRRDEPWPPRLLAEGDSWFQAPSIGIINTLSHKLNVPIFNLADVGDTFSEPPEGSSAKDRRQAMTSPTQINRLKEVLRAVPFEGLLLSGGGNDLLDWAHEFIREDFKVDDSVDDVVISDRLEGRLDEIIKAIIELGLVVRDVDSSIKIFLHEYTVPTAIGKESRVLFWVVHAFFSDLLNDMCIKDRCPKSLISDIVKVVLDRFAKRIRSLCSSSDGAFILVPTSRVKLDKDKYWEDELHPSDKGRNKLVNVFVRVLEDQYPKRLLNSDGHTNL